MIYAHLEKLTDTGRINYFEQMIMILQESLSELNYDGKKGEDYIEAQVGRLYKSNLIS